jgi:hypothetical protein
MEDQPPRRADRYRSPTEMTGTVTIELNPNDLRLLGHYYQNDFRLDLTNGPDCVSIDPPASTWKSMAIMTTVIGMVFHACKGFKLVRFLDLR